MEIDPYKTLIFFAGGGLGVSTIGAAAKWWGTKTFITRKEHADVCTLDNIREKLDEMDSCREEARVTQAEVNAILTTKMEGVEKSLSNLADVIKEYNK